MVAVALRLHMQCSFDLVKRWVGDKVKCWEVEEVEWWDTVEGFAREIQYTVATVLSRSSRVSLTSKTCKC